MVRPTIRLFNKYIHIVCSVSIVHQTAKNTEIYIHAILVPLFCKTKKYLLNFMKNFKKNYNYIYTIDFWCFY